MKLSVKAALLSCVFLPGAGHWLLGRRVLAATFSVLSVLALLIVMSYVFSATQALSEKIVLGEIQPELSIIAQHLVCIFTERPPYVRTAYYCLIAIWFIALVHAYHLGSKEEKVD
ncbi:hypothetical protein ISG33_12000 [Glaciecola sp. MH2013]|uniref:hypothetical protein n=1 Tax=Glaciecola sp. MH2013 TaxID=2785524 RepID=UPI00189E0389|nr:hypothetical protein [Glaciecola sp. MH2013]MBF7074123.1 hypothetical protein [Glaciecola sp. MH2013]